MRKEVYVNYKNAYKTLTEMPIIGMVTCVQAMVTSDRRIRRVNSFATENKNC
jgi:hypothetical protein